jgi:hypothetical protein
VEAVAAAAVFALGLPTGPTAPGVGLPASVGTVAWASLAAALPLSLVAAGVLLVGETAAAVVAAAVLLWPSPRPWFRSARRWLGRARRRREGGARRNRQRRKNHRFVLTLRVTHLASVRRFRGPRSETFI